MNVSLTPHFEALVKQKVDSGAYNSSSEVIREALRLFEEFDHIRTGQLIELRKAIQDGIRSGKPTPLDMLDIKAKARLEHSKEA
ncbi:MAG: type II toxin-antitoxin system ParD family antitoxin [Alphaproteobacteria bacterium]